MAKDKTKASGRGKAQPVKIPLDFEAAIGALLATPAPPKGEAARKRPRKKKG